MMFKCVQMILWGQEIYYELRTTNIKYLEKFNDVKEGKKSGPEIAYRRTHSYGSSTFELSTFHCILNQKSMVLLVFINILNRTVFVLIHSSICFNQRCMALLGLINTLNQTVVILIHSTIY